jgi:hypothetical protein
LGVNIALISAEKLLYAKALCVLVKESQSPLQKMLGGLFCEEQ